MGVFPARSAASFASSTSTQVTECPVSAKQVPATRPTYPVPTTAMRMGVRPFVYRRCVLIYHTCRADNPCTIAKQTSEPALFVRRNPGVGQARIYGKRLLDRDALRQIARLIDVGAAVVREV